MATTPGNINPGPASESPPENGGSGTNMGVAVGVPVAIVVFLLLIGLAIFLVWRWKYKRKYSMNDTFTPKKKLTSSALNEEGLSTPGNQHGDKNGTVRRPEILLRTPSRQAELYIVRHLFVGKEPTHLTIQTGRIVEVIQKNPNGWWRGMIDDKVGWFPASYVRRLDANEKIKYEQSNSPEKRTASPGRLVKKTHSTSNKKRAPDIPVQNGSGQQQRQQQGGNKKVDTSVRSDKEQLIISGNESTLYNGDDSIKTEQPESADRNLDNVQNEEQLKGYINQIFTVEDEISIRDDDDDIEVDMKQTTASEPTAEESDMKHINLNGLSAESYDTKENFEHDTSEDRLDYTGVDARLEIRSSPPASHSAKALTETDLNNGYGYTTDSPNSNIDEDTNDKNLDILKEERFQEKKGFVPSPGTSPILAYPGDKRHSAPKKKSEVEHTYVAMFPFKAVHREQLSLAPNDVVVSKGDVVNGWLKGSNKLSKKDGWFPRSYVREAHENKPAKDKSINDSEPSDVDFRDHSFDDDITGMAYRVVHPYTATQEGDLALTEGQLVVVFEMLDNGWWRGVQEGKEGWFPGAYVEAIPQTPVTPKFTGNPFSTLPRNYKQGDDNSTLTTSKLPNNKMNTLPAGVMGSSPSLTEINKDSSKEKDSKPSRPDLPKRFIIPKLMKMPKSKSSKKVKEKPARPVPPAPEISHPIAPPRKTSQHKIKRNSVSRPSEPPPRPPSELEDSDKTSPNSKESSLSEYLASQSEPIFDSSYTLEEPDTEINMALSLQAVTNGTDDIQLEKSNAYIDQHVSSRLADEDNKEYVLDIAQGSSDDKETSFCEDNIAGVHVVNSDVVYHSDRNKYEHGSNVENESDDKREVLSETNLSTISPDLLPKEDDSEIDNSSNILPYVHDTNYMDKGQVLTSDSNMLTSTESLPQEISFQQPQIKSRLHENKISAEKLKKKSAALRLNTKDFRKSPEIVSPEVTSPNKAVDISEIKLTSIDNVLLNGSEIRSDDDSPVNERNMEKHKLNLSSQEETIGNSTIDDASEIQPKAAPRKLIFEQEDLEELVLKEILNRQIIPFESDTINRVPEEEAHSEDVEPMVANIQESFSSSVDEKEPESKKITPFKEELKETGIIEDHEDNGSVEISPIKVEELNNDNSKDVNLAKDLNSSEIGDSKKVNDSLLAEIMNSFEDLRSTIDKPKSESTNETENTDTKHLEDDHLIVNHVEDTDNKYEQQNISGTNGKISDQQSTSYDEYATPTAYSKPVLPVKPLMISQPDANTPKMSSPKDDNTYSSLANKSSLSSIDLVSEISFKSQMDSINFGDDYNLNSSLSLPPPESHPALSLPQMDDDNDSLPPLPAAPPPPDSPDGSPFGSADATPNGSFHSPDYTNSDEVTPNASINTEDVATPNISANDRFSHELLMTSPYIVIKTPHSRRDVSMPTEEVSIIARSVDTNRDDTSIEEDSVRRNNETTGIGLKSQLSSFFEKLIPDTFRTADSHDVINGEVDRAVVDHERHPMSKIAFFRSPEKLGKENHNKDDVVVQGENLMTVSSMLPSNNSDSEHSERPFSRNDESTDRSAVSANTAFTLNSGSLSNSKPLVAGSQPAKPPRKSISASSSGDEINESDLSTSETTDGALIAKDETPVAMGKGEAPKWKLPTLRPAPFSSFNMKKEIKERSPPIKVEPVTFPLSNNDHIGEVNKLDDNNTADMSEVGELRVSPNSTTPPPPLEKVNYDSFTPPPPFQRNISPTNVSPPPSLTQPKKLSSLESIKLFTPSKFVLKHHNSTPSPQVINRDISSLPYAESSSDNDVHFEVRQNSNTYNVTVVNSVSNSSDYDAPDSNRNVDVAVSSNTLLPSDERIIGFHTPKPFQKPGQFKKVLAPGQQFPPKRHHHLEERVSEML